jgi:hypothetical protein
MKQRGFAALYLIGGIALLAVIVGVWFHGRSTGVESERTKTLNAALVHEAEMSTIRRKHAQQIETISNRYTRHAQVANQRIRELLQTNKTLLDWWDTAIVPAAADYAWLHPGSPDPVRRGSQPDPSAPAAR